jgi:flagellar hook-basal body complex protein FliE
MDYAGVIARTVPGTFVPDVGAGAEKPVVSNIPIPGAEEGGDASGATSFVDTLKQALSDVNDKLETSDSNMRDLATGATNDIGKVVTSVEEANLALQYTMAIRSKLMAAYTQVSQLNV